MPDFERREFSAVAPEVELDGDITNVSTSISVDDGTGYPTGADGPFFLQIESEDILALTKSGNTFDVTGGRGANGTVAASHDSGVKVNHVHTVRDSDEANQAVFNTIGQVDAAGQLLISTGTAEFDKLDAKGDGKLLIGNGTTLDSKALSGDATIVNTGVLSIVNDAITNAKLANMAQALFKGRAAGAGAGDPTDLTAAQAKAILALVSGDISDFIEAAQDAIGLMVANSTMVSLTYNDGVPSLVADLRDGTVTQAKMLSSLSIPILCTSGTRPGSPTVGMSIFETDTGKFLQYQSATTGWTPPWNTAWGRMISGGSPTLTSVIAAGVGTTETVGITTTSTTFVANRRLRIRAYMRLHSTGPFIAEINVRRGTTTGGTLLAGPLQTTVLDILGSSDFMAHIDAPDTGYSAGAVQWVVTGRNGDIYFPSHYSVEDVGSFAAPA